MGRLLIGILLSTTICSVLAVSPARAAATASLSAPDAGGEETTERALTLARDWGIEIVGLRRSAMGYILDFRYKVVNVEKATKIFGPKIHPQLIDPDSGVVLTVPSPPTTGALRQTRHKSNAMEGRHYFILFTNPGGLLKSGQKVRIRVGELRIDDVVIQ